MEKQVLKSQEIINDVRPHTRLSGVHEVVCESGEVYLTKNPSYYKVGNAMQIEYVEIKKPKTNGGEWINKWTNEPRQYAPKKAPQVANNGIKLLEEISEAIMVVDTKLNQVLEKLDKKENLPF